MSHYGASSSHGGGGGHFGSGPYGGGFGSGPGRGGGKRDELNAMSLSRPDFSNLPAFEKVRAVGPGEQACRVERGGSTDMDPPCMRDPAQNFYLEHPAVTARTDEEVKEYRQKREM